MIEIIAIKICNLTLYFAPDPATMLPTPTCMLRTSKDVAAAMPHPKVLNHLDFAIMDSQHHFYRRVQSEERRPRRLSWCKGCRTKYKCRRAFSRSCVLRRNSHQGDSGVHSMASKAAQRHMPRRCIDFRMTDCRNVLLSSRPRGPGSMLKETQSTTTDSIKSECSSTQRLGILSRSMADRARQPIWYVFN